MTARDVCPRCFSPSCVCPDNDARDEPERYSTRAWRAEAEVARLVSEIEQMRMERDGAREALDMQSRVVHQRRVELEQSRAEAARLKDELGQTRTDYDRLRQKTDAELARLTAEIHRKDMEYTDLNGENHNLRGQLSVTLNKVDRLTAELEQARRLANGWLDDAMALTQQLVQARAVIRDLMIVRNARGLWICESCGIEAPTAEAVQHRPGCSAGEVLASGKGTT